ncbi:putative bifunctional diguanylate cyclase/phosphodiesterase [Lysobacter korlensis]|uniref:Bifunctional diguanylate cyclase/phosphodiesterase n=1 Tax=Lysobacter korlensis TaxID=553636 RepID=A0ABV6RLG3_9GAMM
MDAMQDELTGLRNRRNFLSLLRRCVAISNEQRAAMGLVVVDVDGFAQFNNVHGYNVGDALLCHLGSKLGEVARGHDYVARIGDNRFALILNRVLNAGHVELAIQKLFRLLDVPFQGQGVRCTVPVTVGAALCPLHASQPEVLLRRAEGALTRARAAGKRHDYAPDSTPDLDISDMWDLEMQLGGAIERGEMALHYQPQVCASTLRMVGAEALMRWKSPSRGMVSPDVFIPVAERTGHIRKLTAWALNTALRQAAEWGSVEPVTVSVNLPGSLATQPDLPELVDAALKLWGSPSVQLVLEVTESSLMDAERAFAALTQLRALGVRISIDDFGTGYSCLAYFRNIPADELKIDKTFVRSLLTDQASMDIVRLIVELSHRFGLSIAAEGVEDQETLAVLQGLRCQTLQGYLFGRAMASAELRQWLAERRAADAA